MARNDAVLNGSHALITALAMVRRYPQNPRGTEHVFFGYSRIVHRDIRTFTLMFSNGNKSRARGSVTRVSCTLYIIIDKISI